ncbi:hypothetical protein D3C87_1100430 [compost metagenome]
MLFVTLKSSSNCAFMDGLDFLKLIIGALKMITLEVWYPMLTYNQIDLEEHSITKEYIVII